MAGTFDIIEPDLLGALRATLAVSKLVILVSAAVTSKEA